MKPYSTSNWKEFRDSVIELDGNKCSCCGRNGNEVVLQVHHLRYINGLKPWEYATNDCITLCRGCHATEHGIIKPNFGWEYQGYEDLGELIGTCEKCDTPLRHVFYIFHENWGTIGVGTYCCDTLTDTDVASNLVESQRRYDERKKRFLKSKRWKQEINTYKIRQANFDIEINQNELEFFIKILHLKSETPYKSLEDAKSKVFDVIESGELIEYIKNHNICIDKKKINSVKKFITQNT